MQAVNHAAELAQAARCGQASIAQVQARLNQWQARGKPWEGLLDECCHAFLEHCAEIVETAGTPPRLASNVLGAAVRLAEILGKTGILLAAVDSDLSLLSERVQKLELLYDTLLPRVEAVAGEASIADSRARKAQEEVGQVRSECRQLTKSLRNKWTAAERRAAELGRQVARLRARNSGRSPVRSGNGRALSSCSSGSMLSDADLEADAVPDTLSAPTGTSKAIGPTLFKFQHSTEQVAQEREEEVAGLGSLAAAALDHLLSLTRQARESHPTLQMPWPDASARLDLSATADAARVWADGILAFHDPALASSVKQSAMHLHFLADLSSSSAG